MTLDGINAHNLISKLADLSDCLLAIDAIDDFFAQAVNTAKHLVDAQFASLMMFDLGNGELLLERDSGAMPPGRKKPTIELNASILSSLENDGEILSLERGKSQQFFILHDRPAAAGYTFELRIPFVVVDRALFILSLGPKESGIDYPTEDINALRIYTNVLTAVCFKFDNLAEKGQDPGDEKGLNGYANRIVAQQRIVYKRSEGSGEILGRSPSMLAINALIDRVAQKDVSVLITGESGTGKELVARAVHQKSRRADKPLVAMNCAALPDALVESELFGYDKGAFTGAVSERKGKFEYADGSTLFLDEIADMSLSTQAKLLRVLQDGTFHRLGGLKTLHTDIRLIAATNKELAGAIKNNAFREDLYYRINVVQIAVPPLRERPEDIELMANYYFVHFKSIYNKNIQSISREALRWLQEYDYPGNVRELRNIIERSVIMEQGNSLSIDFRPVVQTLSPQPATIKQENVTLAEMERRHIKRIIEKANYNKSAAARMLGIARKTLREKMSRYNLDLKD